MKQLSLFSQVIILSSVKVGRELKYLVLDNGREYWTILGRALELTEEQKEMCVEKDLESGFGVPMYRIYTAKSWTTESIHQSYTSLLEAHQIDNNYILILNKEGCKQKK